MPANQYDSRVRGWEFPSNPDNFAHALDALYLLLVQRSGEGDNIDNNNAASGLQTLDLTDARVFRRRLIGNATFAFANPDADQATSFSLMIVQDGTGNRTVTWPGNVRWPSGVVPALSTTANKIDVLSFITVDVGATWFGALAGTDFR